MKRAFVCTMASTVVAVLGAVALAGQAGAPTQRVHIPGYPMETNIYPKSMPRGDRFISVGCVSESSDGGFIITDWRGNTDLGQTEAGAPGLPPRPPLIFQLQGDKEMLHFHVGHEVQIEGPIMEPGKGSVPAELKVDSILYLSRTCWKRGTDTPVKPLPASQ